MTQDSTLTVLDEDTLQPEEAEKIVAKTQQDYWRDRRPIPQLGDQKLDKSFLREGSVNIFTQMYYLFVRDFRAFYRDVPGLATRFLFSVIVLILTLILFWQPESHFLVSRINFDQF